MATLSGDELDARMEGSKSAITGETWSNGDSIRIKSVAEGTQDYIAKAGTSNTKAGKDHLHFYNNPAEGEKYHKPNYEAGQRLVEDKQMRKDKDPEYISEKLGNAVRNFMGW
jgi:hypothetical protein